MPQHGLFRFGGWFGGEGDRGMNLFLSSLSPLIELVVAWASLSLSPPFLPPGIENDPQERKRPFKCNSLANGNAVVLTIPFFYRNAAIKEKSQKRISKMPVKMEQSWFVSMLFRLIPINAL